MKVVGHWTNSAVVVDDNVNYQRIRVDETAGEKYSVSNGYQLEKTKGY